MAQSHSQERHIALRYAQALFDLAHEADKTTETGKNLADIIKMLDESEAFSILCSSPIISKNDKLAGVKTITAKTGFNHLIVNFLMLLAENGRLNILKEIQKAYTDVEKHENNEISVIVTSAKILSENELASLAQAIEKSAGKKVHIENRADASLIGGLTLRYGSKELDASVKGKLARAAERLYEGIAHA